MQRQHPSLELPWGPLALCQRTLGSERNRYAIAWPDKLGTDLMVCAGKNIWTPPRNSGGIPWVSTRFSISRENEQADTRRDSQTCLAKPSSQAQTGARKIFRSADHGQDWQPYAVDLYSAICDDHTCIRIYCSVYPQLPPVIGAPWGCCGHASGISFPRLLWFGGYETHATPCSVPGSSYFTMCLKKSERNCLTSYLYDEAILASFFFIRVIKGVLLSEFVD